MRARRTRHCTRTSLPATAGLALAADVIMEAILVVGADERVAYANHALGELFGIADPAGLAGRRTDDIPCLAELLLASVERPTVVEALELIGRWTGELVLRPQDGAPGKQVSSRLVLLPNGTRVAVFRDITDSRQKEEEQLRLKHQLEQARRLEALGKVTGGVVHDFNNLLGAILGFAQFILDDTAEDSALHRYAGHITNAGQQAKSLIEQVLAFSGRQNAQPERIDLPTMVDENLHILNAVIAPMAVLTVRYAAGDLAVFSSRSEILQVLTNLIVNAGEALSGQTGTVTLSVAGVDRDQPEIRYFFRQRVAATANLREMEDWTDADGWHHLATGVIDERQSYVCLAVADTGCGMKAEVAAKAFAPFFTTKGKKGGTGLGLAVVHSVILREQGGILLSTKPGEGSVFRVFLPQTFDARMPGGGAAKIANVSHRGSILLVEDDQHFSDMLSTGLERLGYRVSICTQPMEAQAAIDEDPAAWDLLISDQALRGMTGTELVANVKRRHPALPCLICTAYGGPSTEEATMRAGADAFSTKPIDLGSFSILVKTLIEGRRP